MMKRDFIPREGNIMTKIFEIAISLLTAATISAGTVACAPESFVTLTALPAVSVTETEAVVYETQLVPYRDGFLKIEEGVATYYSILDTAGTVVTDLPFVPMQAFDCDGETVIIGENNQLAVYQNRQWVEGLAPESNIVDFTNFNGRYLAVSSGNLYSSTNLTDWQSTSSDFTSIAVGIASTDQYAIALSENGHMRITENGVSWTTFYYNAYYNEELVFQKLTSQDSSFNALAVDEENMPLIASARSGQVWSKRTAEIYSNYGEEATDVREFTINDFVWDGSQDMMVGNDGVVIAMPSCSKCNTSSLVGSNNWVTALCEGGIMAMMDENGLVELISTDTVRQTAISIEETQNQMAQGTPLIDVRTEEEYEEGHIEGSINMPLADLEAQLRTLYPNYTQTLIFYCGTGMRSQKGLEAAQALGYSDVYNMGAMETWYE